jgi:hypothetical protein
LVRLSALSGYKGMRLAIVGAAIAAVVGFS